ncbi:MAG: rhodanese-like domain-containing protein, partial [Bradymonadaceae bacterium]
ARQALGRVIRGPHERGVRQVAGEVAKRWAHGSEPQLHVVDFRPLLAELKTEVDGSYWQVVLKRLMFRAADRVADDEGHPALVSGEAIGQVSSQTLHNLAAIDDVADRLVLRPLCGYNKEEILEIARDAGLHDVTEHIPEFCALEGPRPVTRTNPDKLDRHESAIDVELVKPLVDDRDVLDLRSLEDEPPLPQVQTDRIPEDAAVVDLRREEAHDRWHYPDALHVPFDTALEQHALLPPDPTYVFYCDVGLKSALIAEKMRKSGFDAFSYEGTISELRELAGESDRERAN